MDFKNVNKKRNPRIARTQVDSKKWFSLYKHSKIKPTINTPKKRKYLLMPNLLWFRKSKMIKIITRIRTWLSTWIWTNSKSRSARTFPTVSNTTTSTADTTIRWKISAVFWITTAWICKAQMTWFTPQTYVTIMRPICVSKRTSATWATTEWKVSTIRRSTSPSTAPSIQRTCHSVSMETTARSPIAPRSWRRGSFIRWQRTQTSICTTIRPSSVLSIMITTRRSVCTVITGRTLEESQMCLAMIISISAKTGELAHSSHNMLMAAKIWLVASTVMAGKNRTIIQWFTRPNRAQIWNIGHQNLENVKEEPNVLSIILIKIREPHS